MCDIIFIYLLQITRSWGAELIPAAFGREQGYILDRSHTHTGKLNSPITLMATMISSFQIQCKSSPFSVRNCWTPTRVVSCPSLEAQRRQEQLFFSLKRVFISNLLPQLTTVIRVQHFYPHFDTENSTIGPNFHDNTDKKNWSLYYICCKKKMQVKYE